MGSWHVRASAASITGACVFAVVTGAGAVFVGDWWGSSHHSTVVTQFVTAPASPAHGGHRAVARSAPPAGAGNHTSGGARSQAQADAQTAQVARSTPAAPAHPAHPARQAAAVSGSKGQGQGNGHNPNGGQGPGGPDPTSSPAPPTASASTPAPSVTPTAGTAGGDQG